MYINPGEHFGPTCPITRPRITGEIDILSDQEKDALYRVIAITIGDVPRIKAVKHRFDSVTVDVVEEMVHAAMECNAQVRTIFVEIAATGGVLTKGWLKRTLKTSSYILEKTQLRGFACQSNIRSAWGNLILSHISH